MNRKVSWCLIGVLLALGIFGLLVTKNKVKEEEKAEDVKVIMFPEEMFEGKESERCVFYINVDQSLSVCRGTGTNAKSVWVMGMEKGQIVCFRTVKDEKNRCYTSIGGGVVVGGLDDKHKDPTRGMGYDEMTFKGETISGEIYAIHLMSAP
ncbi:hypothetical protein [Pseudomonas soli]|uniref:hypothetical protein n=1 Tax=Pseudomonas soli TaxID=1306993 RepID=UPI00382555E8